ncbi:2,3-bisphosphoglycerate-dependent phosphoglycerate mutase [Caballeronia sp. 15711]|uniref:2,3-bisphosphoglycerate-dependent phosphoglycerate mutase n=1 Tax=Caballeronia sp. 15711 TaxID=3391029 RepID=UPI0039E478CE
MLTHYFAMVRLDRGGQRTVYQCFAISRTPRLQRLPQRPETVHAVKERRLASIVAPARNLTQAGYTFEHGNHSLSSMSTLVLLRHGQSVWNQQDRFTGWVDVPLTEVGEREAGAAGVALLRAGLSFDVGYTSALERAASSLWQVQLAMNQPYLPIVRTWRLNDRHYGALTGQIKTDVRLRYGEDQFKRWRRGFLEAPPPLNSDRQRELFGGGQRIGMPETDRIPFTESLKDTWERIVPFWTDVLGPALRANQRVIVVAHGNSLRALIKHLEGIDDSGIAAVNVTHGQPTVYEVDGDLRATKKVFLNLC